MASSLAVARQPNGAIEPVALPSGPRCDPLVTSEGNSAFRITGAGAFGLEELMHQEHRSGESKIEAVYFKTESGNIYKAVGTHDGVLISDSRGSLVNRMFHFDAREGEDLQLCAGFIKIGCGFTFNQITTNKIDMIEFVTSEKISGDRLSLIQEWGAAKNTMLVDLFAGSIPVPDVLPRQAADLRNAETVFEHPLQDRFTAYVTDPSNNPAPAMYVETESGGRLVVFAHGRKIQIVDINKCAAEGKFEAQDFSSFWHPDVLWHTRTLTVGDRFRYAVPSREFAYDYYETNPVKRIVPLENFNSVPQGIAPEDFFIRALHAEIKFTPVVKDPKGDTTVISSGSSGDTTVFLRPVS